MLLRVFRSAVTLCKFQAMAVIFYFLLTFSRVITTNPALLQPLPPDWKERIDRAILQTKDSTLSDQHLFQGDIQLEPIGLSDGISSMAITGQLTPENMWPNGGKSIPFNVSESLGPLDRRLIENALRNIEHRTSGCLTFKPADAERDFLYFRRGFGCNSFVGRQGGKQIINLDVPCMRTGIIQHEVLHALGLFHEQSRPDRDQYVEIFPDNVEPKSLDNFERLPLMPTYNVGYDLESLMHYGAFDFARDQQRPTLIPRNGLAVKMGQRAAMTVLDAAKLMVAYNCKFEGDGEEAQIASAIDRLVMVPVPDGSVLHALVDERATRTVAPTCPLDIPQGRSIDNCDDDAECHATGRGALCCAYCGDGRCNRYCRGPGTNGDQLIRRDRNCPNALPPNRPVDDCRDDRDCKRTGRGTMCCAYCGEKGCHRYCRGTGSNGDDAIGGGMNWPN